MEKNKFNKNGFFKINNLIPKNKIDNLNKDIFNFANQFSSKINNKRFKKKIRNIREFSEFCINLEKYDAKFFFHFVTLLSKLNSFLDLINFIAKKKVAKN